MLELYVLAMQRFTLSLLHW